MSLYQVKIVVGDWSGDGHDMQREYVLATNTDPKTLEKIHESLEKLTGIDFESLFEEYGQRFPSDPHGLLRVIPEATLEFLRENNEHSSNPNISKLLWAGQPLTPDVVRKFATELTEDVEIEDEDLLSEFETYIDSLDWHMYAEDYVKLWIAVMKTVDPNLELHIVPDEELPTISIGGYGLADFY